MITDALNNEEMNDATKRYCLRSDFKLNFSSWSSMDLQVLEYDSDLRPLTESSSNLMVNQ